MDPKKILTVEEVTKASEVFFPLFNIILEKMPENSSIEDSLKVMESVCQVAMKLRMDEEKENFGFNKLSKDEE